MPRVAFDDGRGYRMLLVQYFTRDGGGAAAVAGRWRRAHSKTQIPR